MFSRLLSVLALATLAVGPVAACAADTDDTQDPADTASGEDEEMKAAKLIKETDDGKTVNVAEGQSFTIQLASNPTTGYRWHVASVDKTLGQPKDSYKSTSPAGSVGGGGVQTFVWSGKSPLDLSGDHKISLEYARGSGTPARKFSVTVHIADSVGCGTGPACGAGRSCSFCWGHLACIPKGAMC